MKNEIIVSAVDVNAKAHLATTGAFSQTPIKGVEEIHEQTDIGADAAIQKLEDAGYWLGAATRMDYDEEDFTLLFLLKDESNNMKVVVYMKNSMREKLESLPWQVAVDYMMWEMRSSIHEMIEESETNPKDKYDEFRAEMRWGVRQ